MENLIKRWTQSEPSFPKSGHFFLFKKGQGRHPLSPPLLVDVAEYSSTSLNIPKYHWNCSDYARGPNMHDYLTCSTGFWRCLARVLNKSGFWIWHGCIWKGFEEFWICLIMAPYASVMPECALKSHNILAHGWILLSVLKYAWKYLNKLLYVRVLNMLWHS